MSASASERKKAIQRSSRDSLNERTRNVETAVPSDSRVAVRPVAGSRKRIEPRSS
jgi:hypothetical protein